MVCNDWFYFTRAFITLHIYIYSNLYPGLNLVSIRVGKAIRPIINEHITSY